MSDELQRTSQPIKSEDLRSFSVSHYQAMSKTVEVFPVRPDYALSTEDIQTIATICNQPAIYKLLFAAKLKNQPYTTESAEGFIKWAQAGWQTGEHFVFLIRDNEGQIIGAIDIKSNRAIDAEVGYWMDAASPGYMTNVLLGLITMAREAGFKSLVAFTDKKNESSKRVLLRAGFIDVGDEDRKGRGVVYHKFRISLA